VAHPHDQDDELLVHDFVDDPVIANAQPVAVSYADLGPGFYDLRTGCGGVSW
jgi:hypothetical protein